MIIDFEKRVLSTIVLIHFFQIGIFLFDKILYSRLILLSKFTFP